MIVYRNQKVVRVIKALADKNNLYAVFNEKVDFAAMRVLSGSAYKLWSYLGHNQNEHEFALSSEDVHRQIGMCRRTYTSAIKELRDKGYLVDVELYPNQQGYLFIEHGDGGEKEEQE